MINDMISYVTKAAVEELKLFLEVDALEGIRSKLDNLYVVFVL